MAYIGKRPGDTFPSDNAITNTLIADNAITAVKIAENAITSRELAANTIAVGNISDNAVDATKIASNSILTRHIDDNQVTGDQIANDAVGIAQMAGLARGKLIIGDTSGDPSVLAPGSSGQVLKSDGTDIAWGTDLGKTNEEIQDVVGAMFTSNTETGIAATYEDGDGTIDLVVATLNQDTTGTADNVTVTANNSTDETVYPVFVDGATGSQGAETDTGLTYNPSTGMLTATGLTATVTGNITGNVTGNTSGTAATVTTAAQTNITSLGTLTALTIDDVAVDGKAITMTGSSGDTALILVGTNGTLDITTTDTAAAAANIQITADGTAELAGTTVTLDSAGGVTIDADGGTITFADGGSSLGTITSAGFTGDVVGDVTGNADTATALAAGRTLGMTGDVVWTSPSFTGSGNVTAAATIQSDAVEQSMIADDAVGADQLATNAVVAASIVAGSVTTTEIAANTIATGNIADNAIDSTKIAQNSILTRHIDDGQVTSDQLAGSVANAKLANSTITVSDGSNTTATALGGTITFAGTTNEVNVAESSGTITIGLPDDVTIAGNLTVQGDTTTVSTATLAVEDPLVALATGNNAADAVDIGLYGLYDTSGSQDLYAGLFRDASDSGKWKLFKDNQAAPTTTVNTSGTGYAVGTLVANLEGNNVTATGALTLDAAGDIILDADDDQILLKDAGTEYGGFNSSSSHFNIFASIADKDIIFTGSDGGSAITALTLDMSAAGKASFNSAVDVGGTITINGSGNLNLPTDSGTINLGADADLRILHTGSAGQINNTTGNLTLDVAGDIILDADGGDIKFQDAGTDIGSLIHSGNDLQIKSAISDGDMVFRGNDGGSIISALTLDMSQAGRATFNEGIVLKSSTAGDFGVNINTAAGDSMKLQVVDTGSSAAAHGTISVSDGNLTLDVAGDIVLDAAGDEVIFSNAGTEHGRIVMDEAHFKIKSIASDADVFIQGNDGGSGITAVRFDMSNAGAATFNSTVTASGFVGDVTGNADTFTASANNSTDETVYPVFVDGATGTQGAETDTGFTYNPNSGLLTTTLLAGTLNTAAQTNITSLGTLTALTVAGSISQTDGDYLYSGGGNFDIKHTIASQNIVFSTTPSGGSATEILRITHDGKLSKLSGDLTIDVAGDIILDADGGDIKFKDGGTAFGGIFKSGDHLYLQSDISDGDIKFYGNDGGSAITALTLDMSAAGAATFNGSVTANAGVVVDELTIDADTITATDDFIIDAAGEIVLDADNGGQIQLKDAGTEFGRLYQDTNRLFIQSIVSDADILIRGNDGGSTITALTLDMSDGGVAFFNDDIRLNDAKVARFGDDQDFRISFDGHGIIQNTTSDSDILFKGNDGGSTITALTFDMSEAGAATFNAGASLGGNLSMSSGGYISQTVGSSGGVYHSIGHSGNENWSWAAQSGSGSTDYVDFGIASGTRVMTWQEDGKVGIGTASPSADLHIYNVNDDRPHVLIEGYKNHGTNDAPILEIYTNDETTGGIGDNTSIGIIRFSGDEKDGGTKEVYAEINAIAQDPGQGASNKGKLRFRTQVAGDIADSLVIDGYGNLNTPAGTVSASNIVTSAPSSGSGKLTGHVWYVV